MLHTGDFSTASSLLHAREPSAVQVLTFIHYYQQYYGCQLQADEARKKLETFLRWLDAARAARRKTAPERASVIDSSSPEAGEQASGHGGLNP